MPTTEKEAIETPAFTMEGPLEVLMKVFAFNPEQIVSSCTLVFGAGQIPTKEEMWKELRGIQLPDGWRFLTKSEYWNHITAGKIPMPGSEEFDG